VRLFPLPKLLANSRRKTSHALTNLIVSGRGERQSNLTSAAIVHEERAARDVDHTVLDGAIEQPIRVESMRQGRPQEKTAARIGPRHRGIRLVPESSHHDIALVRVMAAKQRDLPLEDSASTAFVDNSLIEGAAAQIASLFSHFHLHRECWRRIDPGDPEARRKRLREAA
jgi:hypothetical protein